MMEKRKLSGSQYDGNSYNKLEGRPELVNTQRN